MGDQTLNAEERINGLINLTRSLSNLIDQENHILTSDRPAGIVGLQEDKARLAGAYAKAIRDVAANRKILSGASDALLSELREITVKFEAGAERQKGLLSGAQQASAGLVKAVADEVAATEAGPTYGAAAGGTQTNTGSSPVFINQRT